MKPEGLLVVATALVAGCAALARETKPAVSRWTRLPTESYQGKQDDVWFVDPLHGWYGNGLGNVFGTQDGGASWKRLVHMPGTYVRAVAFLDEKHGFLGNIGTDCFPAVTDENLLYETLDAGATWKPLAFPTHGARGICAIDVVTRPFVNAGRTEYRTAIHAGGRVDGPGRLFRSTDLGRTWKNVPLPESCGMVLDVKFFDFERGLLCCGTDPDIGRARGLVLATSDGGATWTKRWEGPRAMELVWKCSFPTRDVGYATLQNCDDDPKNSEHWFLKTTDGGLTWTESLLVDDPECREFGVGFESPEHGWIGTTPTGWETWDGGGTWARVEMGRAVNKVRFVPTDAGRVAYAIGNEMWKLDLPAAASSK